MLHFSDATYIRFYYVVILRMKYHCEHCNYSTENRINWCKHKKTNKHIKNSNEVQEIQHINPEEPLNDPDKPLKKCNIITKSHKQDNIHITTPDDTSKHSTTLNNENISDDKKIISKI